MNLQPNDIILKNTKTGEAVWLSQRLVQEVCGVDDEYFWLARNRYKKSVQACYHHLSFLPDSGKGWRWAKTQQGFYYDLRRIPNRAPQHYREMFGDAEALVRRYEDFMSHKDNTDFERLFKNHLKQNYPHYLEFYPTATEVQRDALAKACAVLDFLLEHKDSYPGTKNKIYKDLEPVLKKMDMQYIPHHHLRLKEKIDELFGTESLSIPQIIRLPRSGNNNSAVYADAEVVSWVMQLRQMPQNFSNEHIIRKITAQCEITGKRVPSRRWFGQTILELPATKFLTYKRFGSSRKSHIHKGYIPFQNALFAGDCWEIDATRVNIISHQDEGKDKFLVVVAVRDVHSGDILGYSFAHAENHMAYIDALKMAVQHAGYLPYEIVTDKFPGHNTPQMTDLFERMRARGTEVTFGYEATHKPRVERFFRTLQSVFMMDSDYYYGEGIMSRSLSAFRSPEYLAKIKKESRKAGFDLYKAVEESTNIIERYRETPYSSYSRATKLNASPKGMHDASEKPHVQEVSQATISMLFGLKKKVKIQHNGQIQTEILGEKLHYFISPAHYEIIKNYHGQSVVLSYDLEDLETVFLWEERGHLLKSLCEAEYFEPAQRYGPAKAMKQVGVAKARAAAIEQMREKDLQQVTGEDALLLGRHGQKEETNTADDYYDGMRIPLKKASGSDMLPDDDENGYLENYRSEY